MRLFIEQLPVPAILVDDNDTVIFLNACFEEHLLKHQFLDLGQSLRDLLDLDYIADLSQHCLQLPQHQLTLQCTLGSMEQDDLGYFRPVIFHQEEVLTQHKLLYQQMFQLSRCIQLIIDPSNGNIHDANLAACQYYQYSLSELQGMRITEINTQPMARVQAEMKNAAQQKRNHFNFKHRLKSGEIRDIEAFSSPITLEGKPLLHSIIFDVSRRQRRLDTLVDDSDRLLHERNRMLEIIRAAKVGTWEWFPQTGGGKYNEQWASMLGYTLSELEPINFNTWERLCHPDDVAKTKVMFERHFRGDIDRIECECRLRHKDGHWVWVLDSGQVVEWDEDHSPIRVSGTHTDISQQKQNEAKLQLSAKVFSNAREGILITDKKTRIIEANEAFCRITGYAVEEILGKTPAILRSKRQSPTFYRDLWQHLALHDYWSGEIWNRRKNGDEYVELLTITAVRNSNGEIENFLGIFSDITTYKLHQQQLEYLAHFDSLTGLPNRVQLGEKLTSLMKDSLRYEKQLALAFIDLDGFKEINDLYGHDFGDEVLGIIAQRMQVCLRDGDMLSRLGGDEFVATIAELQDRENYLQVVSRLLKAASEPFLIDGRQAAVSASIGVSFYPQQEDISADQLIRQADQAMYQAKLGGKNHHFVYVPEQEEATRSKTLILEDVRRGLIHHEFELYYQPQINLRKGVICGVEALIRWNHPEQGLVSPAKFIPATEEHPISIDLGEWVINQALKQVTAWEKQDIHLPISINISPYHLQQENFPERLARILHNYPKAPNNSLEIEILETTALGDLPRVLLNMQLCTELGVSFSLDDFGTGYSSLAYLRRLPVKKVKIDQTFIRDILFDVDDLTLTNGMLGLAKAYHLDSIAEGVETADHCISLLLMGCNCAQGYGLGMPMKIADFASYYEGWQADPIWQKVQTLNQEDMPVLYTMVVNQALVSNLESRSNANTLLLAEYSSKEHDLGLWLTDIAPERFADHPSFSAVSTLHTQLCNALDKLTKHKPENQSEGKVTSIKSLTQELKQQLLNLFTSPSNPH